MNDQFLKSRSNRHKYSLSRFPYNKAGTAGDFNTFERFAPLSGKIEKTRARKPDRVPQPNLPVHTASVLTANRRQGNPG